MISCLWNKILTSLLSSIQSCSFKSWARLHIASNFDRSRRGSQTQDYRQVSSAKNYHKLQVYCVSSIFATGCSSRQFGWTFDWEVQGFGSEAMWCSEGIWPKHWRCSKNWSHHCPCDPYMYSCRRHSKWQTKSPSKLLLKIPLLSQRVTTTKRKDSIYLALIYVHVNRYITTDWTTGKSKNVWVSCDLTG